MLFARYTHHNNSVADRSLTTLGDQEYKETWIRCFAALAMAKKLKDEKASGGENEIMDLFLATTNSDAVKEISVMSYSKGLEFTYEEIFKNN